jgi:L-malate glycosyltransferase
MRILELLMAPMIGGAETLVAGLAREWRQLGHEVNIATLGAATSTDQQEAFVALFGRAPLVAREIAGPLMGRSKKFGRLAGLWKILHDGRYDVLHTHSFIPNQYGRLAALTTPKRPVIVQTLHSAAGVEAELGGTVNRRLETLLLQWTDAVVAVAESDQSDYQAMFPIATEKTFFIPNGLSREMYTKSTQASVPSKFISVSRLNTVKGISTLLEGFTLWSQNAGWPVKLLVVGPWSTEDFRKETLTLWRSLGSPAYIEFLGPRTDIADLLNEADVFVSASRQEAHPIAVIEAICAGLPLVLSDIPAHRDIMMDFGDESVYLFSATEASRLAEELASLTELWPYSAPHGRKIARLARSRYSIRTCAEAYLQVFRSSAMEARL